MGRAPLLGKLEDMLRRALHTDISLHRGPIWKPYGIRLPGRLREKDSVNGFLSWTQRILRF
jgi:hypothetical protein